MFLVYPGYALTTSTSAPSSWTSTSGTSQSVSFVVNNAGTYYIWAKDNAGNTSYKAVTVLQRYTVNFHPNISNVGTIGLPDEYRQVEYIESTGTQWIDTGVAAKASLKTQIKFNMTENTGESIFGSGTDDGSDLIDYRFFNHEGRAYLDFPTPDGTAGEFGSRIEGGTVNAGTTYELELGNFYVKNLATGSNIISGSYVDFADRTETLKMWKHHEDRSCSTGKLYYLKIYDNNSLIRDYIPCYRTSDGEVGLWDSVTRTFYTNSGESKLVRGPLVENAQDFSYNESKKLNANTFAYEGYTFTGWNTKADGTGISYADEQQVLNLSTDFEGMYNLYAQWTPNPYTIAFNGNGATSGSTASMSMTYGTAKNLTANGFSRTGYTFAGWNTTQLGNGTNYVDKASVNNLTTTSGDTITLYAKWTVNQYTVEYYQGTTKFNTTTSATYGTNVSLKTYSDLGGTAPSGWTFAGWGAVNSTSATSVTYTDGQNVTNLTSTAGGIVKLYAVFKEEHNFQFWN